MREIGTTPAYHHDRESFGIAPGTLRKLRALFDRTPGLERVWVYGSRARGDYRLTPRQREILHLIARGYATREIAVQLHVSVKTVDSHRAQLMQRLNIHDVASLTRFAIRNGIVPPDC